MMQRGRLWQRLAGRRRRRARSRAFIQACASHLTSGGGRRPVAVVLVGDRPSNVGELLRPLAEVHEFRVTSDASSQHARLAAIGPLDLIVDDTRRGAKCAARFKSTFFHLRAGGGYVVRAAAPGDRTAPDQGTRRLLDRLERDRRRAEETTPPRRPDALELAASVGSILVEAGHVRLTCSRSGLAKLREEEADLVLRLRGPSLGRVLERRPGARFESRCRLRTNAASMRERLADEIISPPVALREYRSVECHPGQVVVRDNLLLPDTFRHNRRPRLRNLYTTELAERFATLRFPPDRVMDLPGTYFYLDSEFRGHFGHAMTEQLSRLWAWASAKREHPDIKALVTLNKGREIAQFERDLYAAAGVPPEDLVLAREPVRVERLVAATPMFSQPDYVHPELSAVWAATGWHLAEKAALEQAPRRIFCSRREDKRSCRNAAELEARFTAEGFQILYPEDYSMAAQAALFRRAEVVAGYAGSAMFGLLFSPPKHVILVTSSRYHARNEFLIASVVGHHLDLVGCEPDLGDAPSARGPRAVNAGFTFDEQREGRFLDEAFAALPQ